MISVRKPRLPKFTPSTGIALLEQAARGEQRAVAAQHHERVGEPGHVAARRRPGRPRRSPARRAPRSPPRGRRARRASRSQATRSASAALASFRSGRARMPIVFMPRPPFRRIGFERVGRERLAARHEVQEELAVARGARRPATRTRRARRSPRAWAKAATSRERLEVQRRVADDPAAAHLQRGPTSNCGFTSTSDARARREHARAAAARILSTEMKDTSITAKPHGSGTSSGESARAFVRSRTTTRGSWRSRSWSWPRPTSIA